MEWVNKAADIGVKAKAVVQQSILPEAKAMLQRAVGGSPKSIPFSNDTASLWAPCALSLFPDLGLLPSAAHVRCQLQCLCDVLTEGRRPEIKSVYVLLVYCNVDPEETVNVPTGLADVNNLQVTVLSIEKSRFPGFPLSKVTSLFALLDQWYNREKQFDSQRIILFVGQNGPSKALFLALAFRIWQMPNVRMEDQLLEGLARVRARSLRRQLNTENLVQSATLHETIDIGVDTLFPSQIRMLRFWQVLCRECVKPSPSVPGSLNVCATPATQESLQTRDTAAMNVESDVTPKRQVSLSLESLPQKDVLTDDIVDECAPVGVLDHFVPQRLTEVRLEVPFLDNKSPVLEIWTSDTSVYTTDIWCTKSYQVVSLGQNPVPLRCQIRHDSPSQWTLKLLNSPRLMGDILLRVLPSSGGKKPVWMLRVQLHTMMFQTGGDATVGFQNDDIDGYDLSGRTETVRMDVRVCGVAGEETHCLSIQDFKKELTTSLSRRTINRP
eukprot:Blabericola_migrator_1__4524@NODE_240_length_10958_cov_273_304655_g203_i0_p3_GENE_NODE_240_length_10958_cov_273_304655_g203_i0NODE_240_length_10958_cov_273_304655_g203_i0_p3_ORF_typecomplete_len496_score57_89PTEN_C2/PF10409_9/3_6e05_NODE_240_length_10958_cov_273_304655_g203_i036855172